MFLYSGKNKTALIGLSLLSVAALLIGYFFLRATSTNPAPAEPTPTTTAGDIVEDATSTTALIRVTSPLPNERITSPAHITGEARGTWYFEATFPIVLTNWDGLIIGQGYAEAQADWMTTEFVPFSATLEFTANPAAYSDTGTLILQKDNPSGLPQFDDALEIPVTIGSSN